jgi:KDO2-lipid IV(A) lauroyltransferase
MIGPWIATSRVARDNLRRALPELDDAARERILREVWDSLGRISAEYPHLDVIARERTTVVGLENDDRAKASGRSIIYLTGHIANWEIPPRLAALRGTPIHVVYRAANNPLIDAMVCAFRGDSVAGVIAKGASGAKQVMRLLARGAHLGMLLDQKQNDGIAVPFFGRPAMTAPAAAALALRYDAILLPVQVIRLDGAQFRVVVHPPLEMPRSGDRERDVHALMTAVNATLESWIREHPGQWLWLHRRWPREEM